VPFFIISWPVISFLLQQPFFSLSFSSTTTRAALTVLFLPAYSVDAVAHRGADFRYLHSSSGDDGLSQRLGLRERSSNNTTPSDADAGRLNRYPVHSTPLHAPYIRPLLSRWIAQSSRLPYQRLSSHPRAAYQNSPTTNNTLIDPQTHHLRHKHIRLGRPDEPVMHELA